MSHQHKEAVIQWFEEVWNQGNRKSIDSVLGPDFLLHDGTFTTTGPEAFKAFFERIHSEFSNIHIQCHEAMSVDDYTFVRWTVDMRQTDTDKLVHTNGMTLVRFAGDRIAEAWQNWDMLGFLQQADPTRWADLYIAPV